MIRLLRLHFVFSLVVASLVLAMGQAQAGLIISGVFDAPLPGGDPKGVELTATADIPDLSVYGLEVAGNGNPSNGVPDTNLPAGSLSAGDHYYVTNGDGVDFAQWFSPLTVDLASAGNAAVSHNGDDVILLWKSGAVHDQFGVTEQDGTGEAWESLDGWAYRNNGSSANGGAFDANNWTFSGANVWDGDDGPLDDGTNALSSAPMPIGTYSNIPEPASIVLLGFAGLWLVAGTRRKA